MAAEPRLLLGLRRLDALGLVLCAVSLSSVAAAAAVVRGATDPSAAGGQLVWQQVNGPGMLRLQSGRTTALPGAHPALGPSSIAWLAGGQITVADQPSLTPRLTIPVAAVTALAVSDQWVVYREANGSGGEQLTAVALSAPATRRQIAGPLPAGEIGRPALVASTVVFTLATPRYNEIASVNIASGARRVLRSSSAGAALLNPSLLGGRLLYERVGRCRQELRIGPQDSPRRDRTVMRLRSTARRDPGYQPGYEHAYNGASLCHAHGIRRALGARLGPTALTPSAIYLTEIRPNLGADLLTLPR
jgi:hypothetical protein